MSDFWLCGCAECDSQRQDSGQTRQSDLYPTMLGASAASEANRFESGQGLPTQRFNRASAPDLLRTPTSRLVRSPQARQALSTPKFCYAPCDSYIPDSGKSHKSHPGILYT